MTLLHRFPLPVHLGFFLLLFVEVEAMGKTLYVSPDGNGQDGQSWTTAYKTIIESVASPSDPEHRDWWNHKTIIRGDASVALRTWATSKLDGFFIVDSMIGVDSAASTTLMNCVFEGNGVGSNGAAVTHWYAKDSLTLINCLIVDNDYTPREGEYLPPSWYYTAIDLLQESSLTLIHCTIADNDVIGREGFRAISSSKNLTILNSIIRDPISTPIGPANVTYSNIIGGFEGEGNIDVDPSFGSQYKLLPDSPCIDTGTASEVLYDIRNLSRPIDIVGVGFDGSVAFDMGAFEFRTEDIPTPTRTRTMIRTPTITLSPTITDTPTETGTPTFTETPIPTPTIDSHADINGDGKIRPEDLLILQREWGRETGQ